MDPLRRLKWYGIWFGSLFLMLSVMNLWRAVSVPEDIWWTPAAMALPLDQTAGTFALSIQGDPLAKLIAEGKLGINRGSGFQAVQPGDVRARVNNLDRIKASRLPVAVAAGAGLGGALVLLLMAFLGTAAVRRSQTGLNT
jgi:hypothetical protein